MVRSTLIPGLIGPLQCLTEALNTTRDNSAQWHLKQKSINKVPDIY